MQVVTSGNARGGFPPRVGGVLPEFGLPALVPGAHGAETVLLESKRLRGKWLVLCYWPLDFRPASATEAASLTRRTSHGMGPDTHLVGATMETPARLAEIWGRLGARALPFPVIADAEGALASSLGVPVTAKGVPATATFIADPEGSVRWASFSDLSVAASGVALVLDALRSSRCGAPAAVQRSGLVTICAWCRRVREKDRWLGLEQYVTRRTGSEFTHGICHECVSDERGL